MAQKQMNGMETQQAMIGTISQIRHPRTGTMLPLVTYPNEVKREDLVTHIINPIMKNKGKEGIHIGIMNDTEHMRDWKFIEHKSVFAVGYVDNTMIGLILDDLASGYCGVYEQKYVYGRMNYMDPTPKIEFVFSNAASTHGEQAHFFYGGECTQSGGWLAIQKEGPLLIEASGESEYYGQGPNEWVGKTVNDFLRPIAAQLLVLAEQLGHINLRERWQDKLGATDDIRI